MLFDTFDRVGKAEFEYPKQVVFRALCEVVKELQGMSIDSQDDVASRLEIKTGMSAFSWGEKVSISVVTKGANMAEVSIQSAAKTVFGSATTHGKNRKNVRQILLATSKRLEQNGTRWKDKIESSTSASEPSSRLIADELIKLADLRDKNILSPEEFNKQKARLLS